MSQKLEYELKGKSDVEQVTGRAKKSVETLGQSFKKAGDDIVKRLTAMFAGAVLFDKAIKFISSSIADLDKVADQIDRSGVSASQFQQLAWAAKMSGVELSVLAKATRQLRVDMAEAANGTGKKIELFKALGITMDQLKSGDASAVFLAISSAMGEGADDSERLLITTALFGDTIGNNIMPMLADFQKLQKDIADAPIVDAKTLEAIGKYNDGMDRLNAGMTKLVAGIFSAYDAYSKWMQKVSEHVSSGIFRFLNYIGLGGAASDAVTTMIPSTPMGAALTAAGADGSTTPVGRSAPAGVSDRTRALLDALKKSEKPEKEKAADTKGSSTGSASSVSGNVIGVGQNPVVSAIHEQIEIAKQQLEYLKLLGGPSTRVGPSPNLTDKGATPSTPATKN